MSTDSRLVREALEESIAVKQRFSADLCERVAELAAMIHTTVAGGGKVLVFGNGGSAADAQHFAAELVGRFEHDRGALAAIALTTDTSALTAIANDYGFAAVFERQVRGLVRAGDVVVGLSTSGNSENVLRALRAARELGAKTVALTGEGGGKLRAEADLLIDVPSTRTARVQEAHITVLHVVCELVERGARG